MTRALHIALSVFAGGLAACEQPQPVEENARPVLSKAEPTFGALTAAAGERIELQLSAQDGNPDPITHQLYARLFKLGATSSARVFTGVSATLSYPPGTDVAHQPLTELSGSFFAPGGIDLCGVFGDGELFAVVADRSFSDEPGLENIAPGGLTNENHWELSCK